MPSWRVLRTSDKWLTHADLFHLKSEKYFEVDAEIVRVEQGEANQPGSDKVKKLPAVFLRSLKTGQDLPKPLGLNSTNGSTIESIVGTDDYKRWTGTRITLYVQPDVRFGRERRPAIRIRPTSPPAPAGRTAQGSGPASSAASSPAPAASDPPAGEMTPEEMAEIERREAKENSR